jgi:hypothetical protein
MPVKVVLDHPQRHVARRMGQRIVALAGLPVLALGVVATFAIFVLLLVLILAIVETANEEDWLDVPIGTIALAWVAAIVLAIVGVTFCATHTIGRSWRLVTLDDHAIAPLGVGTATKRLVAAGGPAAKGMGELGDGVTKTGGWITTMVGRLLKPVAIALFVIAGYEFLRHDDWLTGLDGILDMVIGTMSFDAIGIPSEFDAPGIFSVVAQLAAVLLVIGALGLALQLIILPFVLLLLPMMPVSMFFSHVASEVRRAERATRDEIRTAAQVDATAAMVAQESRKILAPRLIVARVDSAIWQKAVDRFAALAEVLLIDVSQPTENLLWEIREATSRYRSRCVFVGHYDRVRQLADGSESAREPLNARLAGLLDGYEVLAYTTSKPGLKRFARELRDVLDSRVHAAAEVAR